ncbi:hypothetical protein ACFYKX_02005 [Cytobacillus sp. FJAT-54145]|uniref:Uncharacterized protein n=1 Tax=Cytobacillus spartinae TaxID=3299023 RepID=A0ABW6K8W1_9BACI
MEIANQPSFYFTLEDQNGNTEVTGNFTGKYILESGDDLRFKAILALLNSIDRANFNNTGHQDLFSQYIKEIEETLNEMKQHERFQGKTNG